MNKLWLLFPVIMLHFITSKGQKVVSGTSEVKKISITRDSPTSMSPYLEIVENSLVFVDTGRDNKIDANENAFIRFELKNTGSEPALDFKLVITETRNVNGLNFPKEKYLGKLDPGEKLSVEVPISGDINLVSAKANFSIKINDKFGIGPLAVVIEIPTQSFVSTVDINIPTIRTKNSNRFALVIGNENYSNGNLNAEVNVDFAQNDAKIFRDYAIASLGVDTSNMFFFKDLSAGMMQTKIDLFAKIVRKVGTEAELIFYYAGHGLPDENTDVPYLIPVDVDGTNLRTSIKLSELFTKFAETGAKNITLFIDACFSGGGRNHGLQTARSVRIKPKNENMKGNTVLFSACSGNQVALPYKSQRHGMFTYFLLKKMQETNGRFTFGELADYLKRVVDNESLRTNGKSQDPEVQVSQEAENVWRNWTFY